MNTNTIDWSTPLNGPYHLRQAPNGFLPQEVAIICGCLLWLATILSLTLIAVLLKTVKVKNDPMVMKRDTGGAGFYEGLNPSSTHGLVGNPSFVSSPSDQQLNIRGGNSAVYLNRGFEVEQQPRGGAPAGMQDRAVSRA